MSLGASFRNLKTPFLKLLVFLLPTQLGYHFWPTWAYVFGIRIDYLSPTIYLTDIIVGLLAFGWFINKKASIKKTALLGLSILGAFVFINSFYALLPIVSVYKWAKIAELIFVGYLVYQDRKIDVAKSIAKPLALALILVFLLAFVQFLSQRSVGGPLYFLGERTFNSGTPGISLYSVFGRTFLRPYSTFSHPNSMAGFAGASFLFLVGIYLGLRQKKSILLLGVTASLASLILSGSKASFVGLILVAGAYYLFRQRKKLFGKVLAAISLCVVLGSVLLPVFAHWILGKNVVFSDRVSQRLVLADLAGRVFSQNPVQGVGLNNFIPTAAQLRSEGRFPWILQPVHNVPLLVLTEGGIAIFVVWFWLIFRFIKSLKRKSIFFGLIIIFILITASADHYWFTLQQNQLLVAILLGVILRKNNKDFLLN